MPDAIKDIRLHETTRERYLNYALSVITSRALPDVRDGLKPVQRRILYAMFHNLHLTPDAKYRKSAAVIGEVMAKYHPHGDQSIYDAMVRLAQDFSLRYPLVDGQGNFGSLDGDNAAAMRYTEAKLRHLAVELLSEIKKNTIIYRPNYDGTSEEPVVLPAQIPNLLINGATGIAVGMATAIPPHNLKEVIGACIALIDDPELGIDDLVGHHVLGPDFPTGGEILNDGESLREIYTRGRGAIEMRGTHELEKEARTRQIVITSIPYGLNKSSLITEIADHVRAGRVPQLTDIRDESTEDVRIVLELKKGANPDAAMAYLYRRTRLQMRFNVNLTALCPTEDPAVCRPQRLDLLRILRAFLDFRFEVTTRRLQYDLDQLEKRIHILEGFEIIFDALDEAIALIRKSDGKSDARDRLMARFGLDWEQAEAVLETKLYRLAKLEIDAIRAELAEKRAEAARIREILASSAEMWALVRAELKEIREAYGDRRRTLIKGPVEQKSFRDEDYIVREDAFVIVTRGGWFKRQKSYTDISSIRLPTDDELGWVVPASSQQSLILFTDSGRAYTMRVADVPQTTGYGEAIQTRFDFRDRERVVGVATSDPRLWPRISPAVLETIAEGDPKPPYVVALTRAGRCMRLPLEGFCEPSTRAGRLYMRLTDRFKGGDAVVAAHLSDGEELISMASEQGRGMVFPVSEVHVLSGPGKGVMAMKLARGDVVAGYKLVKEKMDGLEVQTNRGKTEVIRPNKYKPCARGGKGREIIKMGHIAEVKFEPTEWHFPEEDAAEDEAGAEPDDTAFDAALARVTGGSEPQAPRPTMPIPVEPPATSLAAGATAALRHRDSAPGATSARPDQPPQTSRTGPRAAGSTGRRAEGPEVTEVAQAAVLAEDAKTADPVEIATPADPVEIAQPANLAEFAKSADITALAQAPQVAEVSKPAAAAEEELEPAAPDRAHVETAPLGAAQVPAPQASAEVTTAGPRLEDLPLEIMPLEGLKRARPAGTRPPEAPAAGEAIPLLVPPVPAPKSAMRPSVRAAEKADEALDASDRLPRLDRIAKMAAERFERRSARRKKKTNDDPNQGELF